MNTIHNANLRFATWCAVSSEQQAAADKVSLEVQREQCMQAGNAKGYQHVRDYIVPGESRTAYASLYHAEKNIPQLHQLLQDAERRAFDLLIVYDLNRFRSLMRQVFDVLCDYGVQLYILSHPRDPVPPELYTDEIKSAVGMIVDLNGIISNSQIESLRRHYRDKMPRRITDRGLHAGLGQPPYGYRKPNGQELNRGAVLEQIPEQIAVLQRIKRDFMAGVSLTQLAATLNREGIPAPRGKEWRHRTLVVLLTNSFYAGFVIFGRTRRQRNRRDGTERRIAGQPVTARGKHIPIWSEPEHKQIIAELARRGQASPGRRIRPLSRLLKCWCGTTLYPHYDSRCHYLYWRCGTYLKQHAAIHNDDALAHLTEALQTALLNLDTLQLPQPEDRRPALQTELRDLTTRRARLLEAYETGVLDLPTFQKRLAQLDERIASTEEGVLQNDLLLAQTETLRGNLQTLSVAAETLPHFIHHSPPAEVNAQLRRLLKSVTVSQDKKLTLNWL